MKGLKVVTHCSTGKGAGSRTSTSSPSVSVWSRLAAQSPIEHAHMPRHFKQVHNVGIKRERWGRRGGNYLPAKQSAK
jgi:hypothetical protein